MPGKLLLLFAVVGASQSSAPAASGNRVLYLFSPGPDPRLQRQYHMLRSHAAGLKERDVVLAPMVSLPENRARMIPMLARFHVSAREFTVILIGKDGGEKLRQHTPLAFEKLAATIDAMPMRKDETKRQK